MCFLVLSGCGPVAHGEGRDNVVVVVIDTLRRDHLATYGYSRDTAPFLDELARQGAVFQGVTPAPWTKSATASLLTGLHPLRHQTVDRIDRLPDAAVTLAERLRREGYHTLAASANGWISPAFAFDRGFETFLFRDSVKARALNRALLPSLDRLRPPFFLYVHYIDPHLPYEPETGWDGHPLPAGPGSRPVTVAEVDAPHFLKRSPELLARARDLYDGEIRGTDDALRELVGQLARRGLMKRTILVVTADHGEELGEHGRMSHGQTVYQEVLQVPLVVRAPGRVLPGRRFGRASLTDVVPTLLDLLGIRRSGGLSLDGQSLAGLLASPDADTDPERPFLSHLDFVDGTGLALTQGRWKLVLGRNPYRKELFDLDADPGEKRNLLGSPEAAAAFSRVAAQTRDLYDRYSRAGLDRSTAALDASLSQSLASLGYAGGPSDRRPRAIPRRIQEPGPSPGGRLGWEPAGALQSCLRMDQADSGRYLLAGWYDAGPGGRWSDRRASWVLAPPGQPSSPLILKGENYRPAPVRLRVMVEHQQVLETEVPCGPFELAAGVAGVPLRPDTTLVEIETGSAYVPAHHGQEDQRSLGLFFSSACFAPSGAGRLPVGPSLAP